MEDEYEEEAPRRSLFKRILLWVGFALAIAFLGLTIYNASWLGPTPRGSLKLIADRGIAQYYPRSGVTDQTCTAARIEPPHHNFLANTLRSLERSQWMGSQMIGVDLAPTADGNFALFVDDTLDCRTDGTGAVSAKTLAELKQLDAGYGYTPDDGQTFPLRGHGQSIPSLEEALGMSPRLPLLFKFSSDDPAEADRLLEAIRAAGRETEERRDAFFGAPGPVKRMRELLPEAWVWSAEEAQQCSKDYIASGWTGSMPESCQGRTMAIPINYQFLFWGWPNKLIERAEQSDTTLIVIGPWASDQPPVGLYLPEQLSKVPASFNGWVLLEDMWNLGPALRPSRENRSYNEVNEAQAALARRREAE